MAESDRPAVYIELLRIDTQILAYRQRLCGKCFICFDQIDIRQLKSGLFQSFPRSGNRSDPHDGRIYPGGRIRLNPAHRSDAQFLRLIRRHYDDCCCAVIDARCVESCDFTIFLKRRLRTVKRFSGDAENRMFVRVENYLAAIPLRNFHRYDFIFKFTRFDRGFTLLLRIIGKIVHLLSGDAPLLRYGLGGDTHMQAAEGVC